MAKKNKKLKNDNRRPSCSRPNTSTRCRNEDCICIGKENLEKWKDMKTRFNFISDQEFASYLLDLFASEKSIISKKSFRKAIENKPPNTLVSEQDIAPDHEVFVSKKHLPCEDSSVAENSSSVIVINKAVINDSFEDSQLKHTISKFERIKNVENYTDSSLTEDVTHTINVNEDGHLNKDENRKTQHHERKNESRKTSSEGKERKQKKNKINESNGRSLLNEGKIIKPKKRRVKNVEVSGAGNAVKSIEEDASTVSTKIEADELKPTPMIAVVCRAPQPTMGEDHVAITTRLCSDCELHHPKDACPLRSPVGVVSDTVSLNDWTSGTVNKSKEKSFAEASLPACLELREVDGKHGLSVVARQTLRAFVQFGPLVGRLIKEREIPDDCSMEHIWELNDSGGCHYLTTSDANDSNWLRYVRPAAVRSCRNVEVILHNSQLVFVTTTTIPEGEELLFWAENTNTAWSHKKLGKTKCGGCNLSFSHTLYYRLHCTVFHDPSYSLTVRKYHCKVCGCSVLGKENIVKHAAEKHNGKGAYQCQFCNKFFLRLNYLEMHRTYGCSANPNRSRPLCDYCGRKFCQPQKLKVHIKRMHSEMLDLRDFQCKHCLKILGSRAALQRHFKEVHQKDVVGAFTCDRCGKMFQNKSNLKIHMLTHSGIKPFKCKEADCPAAFTTKQCLQFHYRKVHGLAEDSMPPIQRSVEYTFDAYAGGRRPDSVNSDSQCSTDGEEISEKFPNEEPSPLSPPISVTGDQASQPPLDTFSNMVASKGSKKWIGESNDIDTSKSNVFDFDEEDKEQDINVSHIDEEPIPMLFHNCKQDSANASLLVEAALDAAERDIDMPSKIASPMSLVTSKESYPVLRSHIPHSPLGLSRPVSPVEYPMQDQSQSPHLAMESCYATMSPRHPYSLMFPERTPHYDFRLSPPPGQIDTFHLEDSRYDHHRRTEENSGDEGVNVVQNLSLGLKNKPSQLDMPYKYDNLEERSFESVEGLDMSRTSGYHHSFVSVTPRYPQALYEPRTYSHTDVLRVVNFSHSVDLSLPRTHHQLTPPMNQTLIEPIRIISPPPPPYQTYPLSTSPPPYTRPLHSPTYHHYNTSY